MKKALLLLCFFSLVLRNPDSAGQSLPDTANPLHFIKVNRISHTVIQISLGPDAITAISTGADIVVIDAGISHSLTAIYRSIAEQEFGTAKVSYLINTHGHGDHTGGNQVFADAVIVGHVACLHQMAREWENRTKDSARLCEIAEGFGEKRRELEQGSEDWQEAACQEIRYRQACQDMTGNRVLALPGLTFSDSLSLEAGEHSLQLFYFGRAHSESDLLLFIPEERLLFSGDLFSAWGRPHFDHYNQQDAARWLLAKQWISRRLSHIDQIIGGHGALMTRKDLISFLQVIDKKQEEFK